MFHINDASCEGLLDAHRLRFDLNSAKDSTTYVMDSSSPYNVIFDGTASGIIRLPNALDLDLGHVYYIMNNATDSISLENYDATSLHKIPSYSSAQTTLRDNTTAAGDWFIDNPAQCNQDQIIWVGKHGNDQNDGRSLCEAKLTFNGAIAAAESLTPSETNRIVVRCVDNGGYVENVVIGTEYINIQAPSASVGSLKLGDNNGVLLGRIDCTSGIAFEKNQGSELSYAVVGAIVSEGSHGILNTSTGGLNVEVEIFSQYSQFGLGDDTSEMGITHADIQDWDLWNDSTGIARGAAGQTTVRFGFMTQRSGSCLAVQADAGDIYIIGPNITADTIYNVGAGGNLSMVVGNAVGAKLRDPSGTAYLTWGGHISQTPIAQDALVASDDGKVLRYNHSAGEVQWKTNLEGEIFSACDLRSPVTADWAINALAPVSADTNNSSLLVRRFDDSVEEGAGCFIYIPYDASNMTISFVSRAESTPGSTVGVAVNMYERGIPDNGAVEAWSTQYNLNFIEFPTNEYFQRDSTTIALTTLGLTPGQLHQLEFTRDYNVSFDTLVGDWTLLRLGLSFS